MRNAVLLGLLVCLTVASGAACDGEPVQSGCPDGQRYFRGQCLEGHEVRLNTVGYLPGRRKVASFVTGGPDYVIRRAEDGTKVLEGVADGPVANADTGEELYHVDFSQLSEPGRYWFELGTGDSAVFEVGASAFDAALETVMLGLYGQRCGEAVTFSYRKAKYAHASCHLEPADFSRIASGTRDDVGGWHDAGDYGKYTRNGAFAVYFLTRAYEQFPEVLRDRELIVPEAGDSVPDILDEARVELEWLLKVQLDDGSFAHKVTKTNFEVDIMPSADTALRFFISASTTSTGNAVAALAQAARVFAPFDQDFSERCLAAATRGQEFLDAHPGSLGAEQSDINTGNYGCTTAKNCSDKHEDERLWALVELWETTGDAEYLAAAEGFLAPFLEQKMRTNFDWADTENLGIATYALSERDGRDPGLLTTARFRLQESAREVRDASLLHGYGRGFGYYYWGANGSVARLSYNLIAAHRLAPDVTLLDALSAQLDHLLGHNAYSRSFVTGLGADPVKRPHHRPSIADAAAEPWPGLLIGGPHSQGTEDPAAQEFPALAWTDEAANYWHNEIAINWNTAIAYALVAALATEDERSASCQPDCLSPPPVLGLGGAGGAGGASGEGPGGAEAGGGLGPSADP